MPHRLRLIMSLMLVGLGATFGCEDNTPVTKASTAPPAPTGAAAAAHPVAAAPSASTSANPSALPEVVEGDFVENERNRDPFRSFLKVEGPKPADRAVNQRNVVLGQYSVDDLKLVAIVSGTDGPRAMLLDPNKRGWVVQKGNYIGKSEIVHVGGQNGADYQVNWRVKNVQGSELLLVREDPGNPNAPPATKVLTLRSDSDKENQLPN